MQPPFRHHAGFQWQADLPDQLAGQSDTSRAPRASKLRLREDGVPLGPAHADHSLIEREGRGRYSFWADMLRFSTSDGSDPNTNGRAYAIYTQVPELTLLGFGSCHLHAALWDLDQRELAACAWTDPGLSYSARETLQLIDFHCGRLDIPAFLHPFALSTPRGPNSLKSVIERTDVVFIELGSSTDITHGSLCMMRTKVNDGLLEPIAALGNAARRVVKQWYHQGLMKRNEAVRRECLERLLELIPNSGVPVVLASEIAANAQGSMQDAAAVESALGQIREVLGNKPLCVLSAYNIFLPDGRPVSWPDNFAGDLEPICRNVGVPLIDTARLVAEHGVAFSLEPDLHHFTPQFVRLLGEEMLAIARRAISTG